MRVENVLIRNRGKALLFNQYQPVQLWSTDTVGEILSQEDNKRAIYTFYIRLVLNMTQTVFRCK